MKWQWQLGASGRCCPMHLLAGGHGSIKHALKSRTGRVSVLQLCVHLGRADIIVGAKVSCPYAAQRYNHAIFSNACRLRRCFGCAHVRPPLPVMQQRCCCHLHTPPLAHQAAPNWSTVNCSSTLSVRWLMRSHQKRAQRTFGLQQQWIATLGHQRQQQQQDWCSAW